MTKLEWCRAHAPEALKDASDEEILKIMGEIYDKHLEIEKAESIPKDYWEQKKAEVAEVKEETAKIPSGMKAELWFPYLSGISLVFGVMACITCCCIPVPAMLASLIAVVVAIVAIVNKVEYRWMAIVAIILGIVQIFGSILVMVAVKLMHIPELDGVISILELVSKFQ